MNKVRLFFKSIVLTTLALSTSLQAGISPLAFNGIFECFKKPEFAPNLGCAALQTGLVNNIRFCMVNPGKDANGNRLWIEDKAPATDPVAALAILLFPSPAGNLTAVTSHKTNLGKDLSVAQVAQLLNFCSRVLALISSMGKNQFGVSGSRSLNSLASVAQPDDKAYFKNFFAKTFGFEKNAPAAPQAYTLISVLCKIIELEEKSDNAALESFYPKFQAEQLLNAFFCLKFGQKDILTLLKSLDNSIVNRETVNRLTDLALIEKNDIERVVQKQVEDLSLDDLWVLQNRDLVDQIIPYARGSSPVNNGLACAYNRMLDQLITDVDFPDCTETVIRHLCNLLLYSKNIGGFDLSLVRERSKDSPYLNNLEEFYTLQTPDKANSGEEPVRNAWAKVVGGFDHPVRYKKKSLATEAQNDTEISSGIINIIRVLNIIFNLELDIEPIYQDDLQFAKEVSEWAQTGLEKMFQLINPDKQVNINITEIEAFTAFGNYEHDCQGAISITVDQEFNYNIRVKDEHSQFDSIDILVPEQQQISPELLENVTNKFEPAFQSSIWESLFLLNKKNKEIVQNQFYSLFQNGISDSTQIIELLDRLLVMTQENKISETRAALILRNSLQMFLWQDTTMIQRIQQTIKNWKNFAQRRNNSTLISVIQEETRSINYGLFKNDFNNNADDLLSFFSNATKLYWHTQDYSSFSLEKEHRAIQVIDFMNSGITNFEISGNCPNLSKITLSLSKELETVTLSGNANKLESLNFSQTGITQLNVLNDYSFLKIIDLYKTKELKNISILGVVETLKKIDLSHSNIEHLSIQSSHCPKLEALNLKFTYQLKVAKLFGSFNQLRKLCLSHSSLPEFNIEGTCPNLITQDSKVRFTS